MSLMDQIKQKAKAVQKTIVLPEGTEERTVQAAGIVAKLGIAKVVLIGGLADIEATAKGTNTDLTGVTCIDAQTADCRDEYVEALYELRKAKGLTMEQAAQQMRNSLFFGAMMVKKGGAGTSGGADGMVAGAINATGDVLRPGLQIIRTAPGISTVSSCFIMDCPAREYGDDGILIMGDCAVMPNPTADELAAIAIASAASGKALAGMEPRVAMLSFSTKGSAKHELVDKVVQATAKVKELAPDLMVDGELQADAALVEKVGQLKSPGSPVAGKANVLIFPDLQSGNIGYKLVQRLAGAEAIGPICQGFAKPINDLSRGCSVEDIVSMVAITAVQATI